MLEPWAIGVIICITGSILSNLGWTIQKYSHMQNQAMSQSQQQIYYKQKLWILGFVIYFVGNLGDFVALAFAAQSLVAPLGSVVLVVNAIMSPCFLNEKITNRDLHAILLILVGDVLIVLYSNHEDTSYSLSELMVFLVRPVFIVFLVLTLMICIFLSYEKDVLDSKLDPNNASFYDDYDKKDGVREKWIKDEVMHPYTYAALAGIVGGISVLLAKCVAELAKVTIETGNWDQFKSPISWVITLLLITSCFAQVHYINQGLERYDSFYIVPMFHVHWNVWSILGGIIFFDEFHSFAAINYGLFSLGFSCILVGIYLLSQREMQNATHKQEKREQVEPETETEALLGKSKVSAEPQ